ncbi:hypothetical protein JTE90_008518 [Oedothorax gibbosus]|uniref:Chitin-binding type-2 domain-containing protein n=1 Tax=Oedothorax gibbosus TaxID=931172 RepID=A0AAV6VIT6_9ARAC|nr:hypothetical protein JTE90_008518 [Oedothorax gibbosus]
MNFYWIASCMLLLEGSLSVTYGETTTEISTPNYRGNNDNPDYPDDYQDPDYPMPDYYGTENRGGRSLGDEIPDPASDENYLRQLESTIPGIPGEDYPMYNSVPETSFRCENGVGFFGDVEAKCQVFHICQEDGRHDSFLCPVGTIFNQMQLVCDWWFNFKCEDTPDYFGDVHHQGPPRMRDAMMKKIQRRFRNADANEVDRGSRQGMHRSRIMNLFAPKMRSGDIWKRRMGNSVEGMSENVMARSRDLEGDSKDYLEKNQDLDKADPEKPFERNQDLKFNSTDALDISTTDVLTTTAYSSHDDSHLETPSLDTIDDLKIKMSYQTIRLNEAMEINDTAANNNNMNLSQFGSTPTMITMNQDTFFTTENVVLDKTTNNLNESSDKFLYLIDGDQNSNLTSLPHLTEFNHSIQEPNPTSTQPNDSMEFRSFSNFSSKLESNEIPYATKDFNSTLGNGANVTVSVTIRAGISRLKWKRLPEVRKNMKLKTDSDEHEVDSPMDLVLGRFRMRNRPNTRIVWVPAKNNALKSKSIWKIMVNSKPISRNLSQNPYDMLLSRHQANHKNYLIDSDQSNSHVSQEIEYVPSTTLQTDNTELAYSFVGPSDNRLPNSSSVPKIVFDEPIALPLTSNKALKNQDDYHSSQMKLDNILASPLTGNQMPNNEDFVKITFDEPIAMTLTDSSIPITEESTISSRTVFNKPIALALTDNRKLHTDDRLEIKELTNLEDEKENNVTINPFTKDVSSLVSQTKHFLENKGQEIEESKHTPKDKDCGRMCINFLQGMENSNYEMNYYITPLPMKSEALNEFIPHSEDRYLKAKLSTNRIHPMKAFRQAEALNEYIPYSKIRNFRTDSNAIRSPQEKVSSRTDTLNEYVPYFENHQNNKADLKNIRPNLKNNEGQAEALNEYIPYSADHQNLKVEFSRRSFLGVSPAQEFSVKYDPDPQCNEDFEEGQDLLKGWSIIVDAGSVTKEKTVKRRGCDSLFNDSKIIVMKPHRSNGGRSRNSKTNYPSKDKDQRIDISTTDQQYWLSLVRNWLDAAPKSKSGPASFKNTEKRKELPELKRKHVPQDSTKGKDLTKIDGSINGNHRKNWNNNPNKKILKNGFDKGSISRRNSGSDSRSKWIWSKEEDSDAMSSQSKRKEWHVDADYKDIDEPANLNYFWNNQKVTSGQKSSENSMYFPKNIAADSFLENSNSATNENIAASLLNYQPRDEDKVDFKQEYRAKNIRGKRDWASQQRNRNRQDFMVEDVTTGISGGEASSIPWSSDYFDGIPSRLRKFSEDLQKSINENPSSVDDGIKTYSSEDVYKQSFSSSGIDSSPNEGTDTNTKSGWSSKGRPSFKDSNFDSGSQGYTPNRDGRRISDDRNIVSKDNLPFPSQADRTNWGSTDSKMSARPTFPSKTNTNNGWSSKDKQQKSDWSPDQRKDEEWTSGDQQRKTDVAPNTAWSSKDQKGRADWASDSKKDNRWSSNDQQSRNNQPLDNNRRDQTWAADDQQAKSDWVSDSKRDQSWSSRDQQEKAGADSDSKTKFPEDNKRKNSPPGAQKGRPWSADDQQSMADWPSISKMNKDWSSRDRQEKSDWSTNNNKGQWSDSSSNRKYFPSQSKGRASPSKSNGKDTPRTDKGIPTGTAQEDISGSALNENNNWNVKQMVKKPMWSLDEDDNDFNVKQNDNNWSDDARSEESPSNRDKLSRRPNSRAQTDQDDSKNIPRVSNGRDWNPDSSADNFNIRTPSRFNINNPNTQSTGSKGDNARDSLFPINIDTRTTSLKAGWDSNLQSSIENIPSRTKFDWSPDGDSAPSFSKGRSSENGDGSRTHNSDNSNKGLSRDPTSSWFDSAEGSFSTRSNPSNGRPVWTDDEQYFTQTYKSNHRDEMNTNRGWDSDEDLGSSNSGLPSWSDEMNDDKWNSQMRSDKSDESKMPSKKGGWPSNPGDGRMSRKNDENAPSGKRRDWSEEPKQIPKATNDWSSKKGSDRSTQPPKTPSSKVNRRGGPGKSSQGTSGRGIQRSKGSTKTGTPVSNTPPSKPWKDEENASKSIKGGSGKKEEKIMWSPQISSNGELGNGWVPVTLRPGLQKPKNQTGSSKGNDAWSGVKQQMDSGWDSRDASGNTPQYKMDLVTENSAQSSQFPADSVGHPFYISSSNRRFKRANRLISITKKYIRPHLAPRRIYNIDQRLLTTKADVSNRFYLASANLVVGENNVSKEENKSSSDFQKNVRDLYKSHKRYNETIKNSIPSLIRIKHLRNVSKTKNFAFDSEHKFNVSNDENAIHPSSPKIAHENSTHQTPIFRLQHIENSLLENISSNALEKHQETSEGDSVMEESEAKELWSSPFDSSNVPESGWIPLFKVNKTSISIPPANLSDNESNLTEISNIKHDFDNRKDLEQIETIVFVDSIKNNSENVFDSLTNSTFFNDASDKEALESEFHYIAPALNFTIDIDSEKMTKETDQNAKYWDTNLTVIPFSDIMKQLRRNESNNDELESTIDNSNSEEEWNIPMKSTPKMYNLKLVNDSEMQNRNIGSSWTFNNASAAWVLVKDDPSIPRTLPENRASADNNSKQRIEPIQRNNTLYRLIVGNRTRAVDVSELKHRTEEARSKIRSLGDGETNRFSFDLKNWQKDSGWTPLIRAIGSVRTRNLDQDKFQLVS